MSVLIRNVSVADDLSTMQIPLKEDGTYYRYEMICDGGWSRLYDDSVEGLIEYMIPGYSTKSRQEKLELRIQHALDMQVFLQSQLNMFYEATDVRITEKQILVSPRNVQPQIEVWNCLIPLVLVDAFYAPYTDNKAPISGLSNYNESENIWWLKPAEGEMEYLKSLHEYSIINLNISKNEGI